MSNRRVVITGAGLTCPIGNDLGQVSDALQHSRHGIKHMPDWDQCAGLQARLGGPVDADLD